MDGDQGVTAAGAPRPLSRALYRLPRARLALLLSGPVAWLVVAYLGSLAVLLASAFWTTDTFTGAIVRQPTTENFTALLRESVYRTITVRTLALAAGVTVIDVLLGFPMAFFMAKVARPRWRRLLVVAVLTPLWASYLVKAYAWRIVLGSGGALDWALRPLGAHAPGFGLTAVWIVLAYLWLPYMVLPVYAGLDRLPDSLLEASSDLGGGALRTFRSVVLPLTLPAVVAGSIFTFSLTLGDYVAVNIVGGKTQVIGNVIYANVGPANNLPFAAAFATVPVLIMLAYLLAARRAGALESL
ncbi:MAG TPA: ABC transporter permease [Actinomycetes bacterium]|nr:ABC transporter permease [Actinomycetes bacterium]